MLQVFSHMFLHAVWCLVASVYRLNSVSVRHRKPEVSYKMTRSESAQWKGRNKYANLANNKSKTKQKHPRWTDHSFIHHPSLTDLLLGHRHSKHMGQNRTWCTILLSCYFTIILFYIFIYFHLISNWLAIIIIIIIYCILFVSTWVLIVKKYELIVKNLFKMWTCWIYVWSGGVDFVGSSFRSSWNIGDARCM